MTNHRLLCVWMVAASTLGAVVAFAPPATTMRQRSPTELQLGTPKFLLPKEGQEEEDSKKTASAAGDEKKVGMKGLLQLITAGAGGT